MSKSIKQQFNSSVVMKVEKELSLWLRGLLFVCGINKDVREYYFQLIARIKLRQKASGDAWTVKYLKECTRLVMVWISKDIEYRKGTILSIGIPVKIVGGLPCLIPTVLRRKMESGDMKTVKVVLTVLNLYRVWPCSPSLKLSTITDPFNGISETLPILEIKEVLKQLPFKGKPKMVEGLNITTAGPNFRISSLSAPFDAVTFAHFPDVLSAIETYAKGTGNQEFFGNLEEECARVQTWQRAEWMIWKGKRPLSLGRLSKKFEAAGKVRIFAITDWWTQNLLKPLHVWINESLSLIAQDGTFDQLKPLDGLTGSYRVSYDLSAATDRLPVKLQVQILSQYLGQEVALAWSDLLTKRDWLLLEGKEWVPYRYAVGQPMGAYSSFPMLALTHHVIVRIAALRCGLIDFRNYALLGDDIVIADAKVGAHYLYIMRDYLGVEINLSKSLESDIGALEFAKRLFLGKKDVSPISPKVLLLALRNIFYLPDLITDMVAKDFEVDTKSLMTLLRRPRLFKGAAVYNVYKAVWSCFSPFGVLGPSPVSFLNTGAISQELLFKTRDFIFAFSRKALYAAIERSHSAKDSWEEARIAERGGLPGEIIEELPSTRVIDSIIRGTPLANTNDYIVDIDLYRDVSDVDQLWFYVDAWLREAFSKLVGPKVAISDFIHPLEANTSRGQQAFDFWSMVHKDFKLPKILRHKRKSKSGSRGDRKTATSTSKKRSSSKQSVALKVR